VVETKQYAQSITRARTRTPTHTYAYAYTCIVVVTYLVCVAFPPLTVIA